MEKINTIIDNMRKRERVLNVVNKYDLLENYNVINIPDAKERLRQGLKEELAKEGISLIWNVCYDYVADWMTDNRIKGDLIGKGLCLMGNPGVGKSLITQKVLPKILKDVYPKKNFDVFSYSDLNIKTNEILNYWFPNIDDIGAETTKYDYGNTMKVFREVVIKAAEKKRLLIFNTNKTLKELEKEYDERAYDRLRKLVDFIVIDGTSLRR